MDEKLFLEANSEHLGVMAQLEPFIVEIRETFGEANYLAHLAALVLKVPHAKQIMVGGASCLPVGPTLERLPFCKREPYSLGQFLGFVIAFSQVDIEAARHAIQRAAIYFHHGGGGCFIASYDFEDVLQITAFQFL